MKIKSALKMISARFLDLFGRHMVISIEHTIRRVLTNHDN